MFTGIITDVGRVLEIADGGGRRMTIGTRLPLAEIPLGGSIATSGICFSAVDKGDGLVHGRGLGRHPRGDHGRRLGGGDTVNLERSLRIGDELGGHIVFGHVDAVGEILALEPAGRVAPPRGRACRRPGAADRGQGLDRGRRHLAHRQRGAAPTASPSTSSRTPGAHQSRRARAAATASMSRSTCSPATSRGSSRSARRSERGRDAMPFAEYLSPIEEIIEDAKQRPHVHPGRRREPRERGRPRDPGRALRRPRRSISWPSTAAA